MTRGEGGKPESKRGRYFKEEGVMSCVKHGCYAWRGLEIDHGKVEVTGDFDKHSVSGGVIRIDYCLKPVAHVLEVICLSHHPGWQ